MSDDHRRPHLARSKHAASVVVDNNGALENKHCAICLEELLPSNLIVQGTCRHTLCLLCAAQHFVLHDNDFCPTCRVKPKKLVVTKHGIKSNSDHDQVVSYSITDKKNFFFFESHPAQQMFLDLFSIYCYICKQVLSAKSNSAPTFNAFDELVKHMKTQHGMIYCDVCLKYLKTFPSNRRVYKPKNIKLHKLRGDFTAGFGLVKVDRHHLCKFCNIWFFDIDSLYKHCRSEHLFCTMCEGTVFDFYEDYDELYKHFKSEHYVCYQDECRKEQYTNIFKTFEECAQHLKEMHNIILKKKKVPTGRAKRNRSNMSGSKRDLRNNQSDTRNINFKHSTDNSNDKNSKNSVNLLSTNFNTTSNLTNHEALLEGTLASTLDEQIEIANLQSQFMHNELELLGGEEYPSLLNSNSNDISNFNLNNNHPTKLSSGYSIKAISTLRSADFNKSKQIIRSGRQKSNWVKGNNAIDELLINNNSNNNDDFASSRVASDHDLAQQLNWSLNIGNAKNNIRANQNTKQVFPKSITEEKQAGVQRQKKAFKKLGENIIRKQDPDFPPGFDSFIP